MLRGRNNRWSAVQVYQVLTGAYLRLLPMGRAIMLAAILVIRTTVFRRFSTFGWNLPPEFSRAGTAKTGVPDGFAAGAALASLAAQQLIGRRPPVLTADQVETFESQILEPALALDGGSCVERTMFATTASRTQGEFNSFEFSRSLVRYTRAPVGCTR